MIWFSTLVPIRPPFDQEPPSNFTFVLIFILVSQLYYVHVRAHFLQTNNLVSNCVVIAWLVNPSQEGSRDNKSVFQSSGFFQNNKHQSFVLHSLLFLKIAKSLIYLYSFYTKDFPKNQKRFFQKVLFCKEISYNDYTVFLGEWVLGKNNWTTKLMTDRLTDS